MNTLFRAISAMCSCRLDSNTSKTSARSVDLAILAEFADRGINLTKIESRPTRSGLGKYFFLIDLEGHQADPQVAEALEGVRRNSHVLKVLGSYPASGQ